MLLGTTGGFRGTHASYQTYDASHIPAVSRGVGRAKFPARALRLVAMSPTPHGPGGLWTEMARRNAANPPAACVVAFEARPRRRCARRGSLAAAE